MSIEWSKPQWCEKEKGRISYGLTIYVQSCRMSLVWMIQQLFLDCSSCPWSEIEKLWLRGRRVAPITWQPFITGGKFKQGNVNRLFDLSHDQNEKMLLGRRKFGMPRVWWHHYTKSSAREGRWEWRFLCCSCAWSQVQESKLQLEEVGLPRCRGSTHDQMMCLREPMQS